jgi:ribosomal protein L40E
MKGKADKLVANRTLSALAVVCLVISAFAGLLFMTDMTPTRAAEGDLIIQSGTYIIENTDQPIDGNVEVRAGGTLIVRDATLSIISNNASGLRHAITVFAGGELILDHGAITPYLDQINPWPFLNINVQGDGELVATNNSLLMFPGNITLTAGASGAFVSLTDTAIMALPDEMVTQFVIGSGGISFDSADDGPAITLTDSTLELYDSSISDLPEYRTIGKAAKDLSLNGESTLLAVNSYIGVDFGPTLVAADWYAHNAIVVNDISHAYLYGTSFQTYSGALADRAPAIRASGASASPAVPLTRGGSDTTSGSFTNLATVDGGTIQVLLSQTLEIDTWDVSGLSDVLPISSATLVVTYSVDPAYSGVQAIRWARQGSAYSDTSIVPINTDSPGTERLYDLPLSTISTVGDVRNLNVRFSNAPAGGLVEFDRIWVVFTVGADAFVYRWLNATVGDEYGVPVANASVAASFTGATEFQGQEAIYYSPRSVSTTPPEEVLTYMGEAVSTYSITKSDGKATIPYLSDIITNSGSMDSMFVGSYDIVGTYGLFSSSEPFSFPAYPAMTPGDQSFDFTVSLIGLSAVSPDPSRWLVVPPSLNIRDMTYYHAGDVIVAAGGTLSFTNSVFQLVQPGSYTKTIYVDGTAATPAKLVFSKSSVTSAYPINIIVKGDGILEVYDSVMQGVDIVIEENATVVFSNVTMDGRITTAWDAWTEKVSIRDSDLSQIPELSGSVVAGFTNTSVPAINVTGDAVAQIYRWIHVTVLDGAGMPLPGVNVSTRYYIKQSLASWAMSSAAPDSLGVAKVNSLGTNLTSIGSTFVGNYWVNATYTYAGNPYYADNSSGEREISLSVKPYEEPLGRNATYATMTIPGALCDLSVNQGYTPVWALDGTGNIITQPRMGQAVTIYGRINNTGVASAYNVTVEFFDDLNQNGIPETDKNELIGTTSVPVIMAGSSGVASISWTASGLVDPNNHTFLVVADRNNMIREIDDATPATASGILIIKSLPDIWVTAGTLISPEIKASVDFVIAGLECDLQARIYNIGDNFSTLVKVDFSDNGAYVGSSNITMAISPGGSIWVSVPWTPANPGASHNIQVLATLMGGYEETSTGNNQDIVGIWVYDHPDLMLSSIQTIPALSVPGGDPVTVKALLQNLNPAPFSNPDLVLYVTWGTSGSMTIPSWEISGVDLTSNSGTVEVSRTFTTPIVTTRTDLTLRMVVNEGRSPAETDYTNNEQTIIIAVTDVRPDLSIVSSDIYVQRGTTNITSETFGYEVNIRALVRDLGGRRVDAFQVEIGVRGSDYNHTIHTKATYNISANSTENTLLVTAPWMVNLTDVGAYEIWVWLDGPRSIAEPDENNNFAVAPFNITQLLVDVLITNDFTEYDAGDMMVITATVTYAGTNDPVVPVKGLPGVVFWLVDSHGTVVPDSHSDNLTTNQEGVITVLLRIPTSLDTGTYTVRAVILGTVHDSSTTIHVSAQVSGGLFPWWVWILIIVAVVGVVAGFTVYTYIYGLGKLVECGECGAFIPAASKRCPKCGVEFEAGTMKCSECGAWIPAESTECSNCGVKFAGETEVEADYLERMKKEYDEMVSKYRELAKPELGKKFSEKAFEAWWKAQPAFISFDDWFAKEEEKKKEGPVPCPVCGTLNPKEASVCHKCGTVFGAVKPAGAPPRKGPPPAAPSEVTPVEEAPPTEVSTGTQAQQMPPAMAPRMVIRRPIDRKVVPKKIIKTPVGGEERKEGEDEEENQ